MHYLRLGLTCLFSLWVISQAPLHAETTQIYNSDQLFEGYPIKFNKKFLADSLYGLGVFQLQTELSSSRQVKFYLDMKDVFYSSPLRASVIAGWLEKAGSVKFDSVCGTPTTGKNWAQFLSDKLKSKLIVLQNQEVSPRSLAVKGDFKRGTTCLLVDDVIASGGTLLESIDALRKEGVTVTDVLVVIDKEEGGEALMKNQKIRLHSLSRLSELLGLLQEEGKISREEMKTILDYCKSRKNSKLN